jgi:signal transduction histidine kinase
VAAIIEDNGVGFEVDEAVRQGSLGLVGMRERAESVGGSLTIESMRGSGTTVYVQAPC